MYHHTVLLVSFNISLYYHFIIALSIASHGYLDCVNLLVIFKIKTELYMLVVDQWVQSLTLGPHKIL